MPRLSRSPLTVVAIAALVGVVLLGGGAAWAAWSVSGTGAGRTAVGSLVTPALTATTSTTSPTSAIDLSWTASGQLAGTTYSVTRNGTAISCTTTPCTDSGLSPSTSYTYVVTAKVGTTWTAPSAAKTASTTAVALSTATTLESSQNPARSGSAVTFTATVSAASGTPTGTVTFRDAGTTISCDNVNGQAHLSGGVATCQTSSLSLGAHSITATYPGTSGYGSSTSAALSQRIVSSAVTGLAFASVKVNGSAATPSCSGVGTGSVSCTLSGAPTGATLATDVGFVSSSGTAALYATDAATTLPWTATSKNTTTSGSVTVAASSTTSTSSASASKSGSNSVTITVSFADGLNSFTATLTLS